MEPPRTMETGGRTHQKKKAPPLVHSPLGERGGLPSSSYSAKPNGGVKGGDGGFSPSPLNPYNHSEYETLWREAEDRAAALALELKFLKDKDDKAKEEVEVQRTLLRNAAAEVRSEVLSMKKNLEDRERDLVGATAEAEDARMRQRALEDQMQASEARLRALETENDALGTALEDEREKVNDLTTFEDEDKKLESQAAEMYSKKVVSLERSLESLSKKLTKLSTADLEEPYPQEMKSNHIWQQAINAAKARSRGQRAAAFAGQARAEARVSSLERELEAQARRNLALEKEVQVAKVRSNTHESRLEKEGKNLMTLSQELEGISQKFHETEALRSDTSETFNAFIGQTKELASSLLSEIEPIRAQEDYQESAEISLESESEKEEAPGAASDGVQTQYTEAFKFLASVVRKSKAAMRYMKASSRAQLQAREMAQNDAHDEREAHKREKKDLRSRISSLENLNEDLEEKVEDLETLLAASSSAKDKSLETVQNELQSSREEIRDLEERSKTLGSERDELRAKLVSLEEEKSRIEESLRSEKESLAEARKTATTEERQLAILEEECAELRQDLESLRRAKEAQTSTLRAEKEALARENAQLKEAAEDWEAELGAADAFAKKKAQEVKQLEEKIAEDASLVSKSQTAVRNLQAANDDLNKSISDIKVRLEGSFLESSDRDEQAQSLRSLADVLKTQVKDLEEDLATKELEVASSRERRSDLEAKVLAAAARAEAAEDQVRDLTEENAALKDEVGGRALERKELSEKIRVLKAAAEESKASLIAEQQSRSKKAIEIEKLNAYINVLKMEVEKYIEALTATNSEKGKLEERLADLKERLSLHATDIDRKRRESEDQKELYEEQVVLLKENLDRKNEQIKLYGASCRDILAHIKESITLAFKDKFPEILEGILDTASDSENQTSFDFDTTAYLSMKKLSADVFPVLKDQIEEDRKKIERTRSRVQSLESDLARALERESSLKGDLETLRRETHRCKEERDDSVGSSDLLHGQIAELKKILEETAIKATETEIALQRKATEVTNLAEDLRAARGHRKELGAIIDLFKEAEAHFSDLFLGMERKLGKIRIAAEDLWAFVSDLDSASQKEAVRCLVDDVIGLQESCQDQRELISKYRELRAAPSFDRDDLGDPTET